jgi:hypothetical protein
VAIKSARPFAVVHVTQTQIAAQGCQRDTHFVLGKNLRLPKAKFSKAVAAN